MVSAPQRYRRYLFVLQVILIDLDHPNYQYVAARLLLFSLRKNLYGRIHELPNLKDHVAKCVWKGIYDSDILNLMMMKSLIS